MNYIPPNQLVYSFDQILFVSKQKEVTNKVIHKESFIIHTSVHKVPDNTWLFLGKLSLLIRTLSLTFNMVVNTIGLWSTVILERRMSQISKN